MKSVLPITVASAFLLALPVIFSPSFAATRKLTVGSTETGTAACYNRRLKGHRTTSGQRYDPSALTAAHHTAPMGSQLRITNLANNQSVVVTVNDHLGASRGIILDISQKACDELKFPKTGEAKVKLEVLRIAGNSTASH
jgi:rare lipoprotein A